MDLKDCRDRIDGIDDKLEALFKERMEVVSEVAGYKKEHGIPVRDPSREKQILAARTENAGELEPYVRRFFKQIMKLSGDYQEERIADKE